MQIEEPPHERLPLHRKLRSAGTALATALVLAFPRGSARAADQPLEPTAITRGMENAHQGMRQQQTAFIGVGGKEKRVAPADYIDLDILLPKNVKRGFKSKDFYFSESLTTKSDLEVNPQCCSIALENHDQLPPAAQEELEELENLKVENAGNRALQGFVPLPLGLSSAENWLKEMERKDIEEEMELTGTYISVDASDVDTAIDPTTGKNMTINRGNKVGKLPCD
ncbi:MAG: hypothetical protein SGPRY_003573 [Prymnesium sp.]